MLVKLSNAVAAMERSVIEGIGVKQLRIWTIDPDYAVLHPGFLCRSRQLEADL